MTASPVGSVPILTFARLCHRRRFGDGFIPVNHEMAQHCVIKAEGAQQLVQSGLADFDVQKNIVRFVDLRDRMGQLAPPPIFFAVNLATLFFDHSAIAGDHGGDLLTLVRMNQEYDFVMTHIFFPMAMSRPLASTAVRQGVELSYCASAPRPGSQSKNDGDPIRTEHEARSR